MKLSKCILFCLGCGGDHLSTACLHKNAELPRPLTKCINCELQHPASYKGCKNFPVNPQIKKSFAEVTSYTKTLREKTMTVPKLQKIMEKPNVNNNPPSPQLNIFMN